MISFPSPKKGFTLIEIMVAVSIFVIVAFITTSTLLALMAASRKAQTMRLIMDNMNFSLDSMTNKIRFGHVDATAGSYDSLTFVDRNQQQTTYCRVPPVTGHHQGYIAKCLGDESCGNPQGCQAINSGEVNITKLHFDIRHTVTGGLPLIQIQVKGSAGLRPREQTNFVLQTSVFPKQSL